jgi:type IV pilus assembly protein PilE
MNRNKGFTLIEMMVTVGIVAILTSIALPSYKNYVIRGHMTDAFNVLASYRISMEQSFQNNNTYGAAPTCAVTVPTTDSYFAFSCLSSGVGYSAAATGQNSMHGYAFSVNDAGVQATTAYVGASTLQTNCWMTNTTGC